VPSPPNNARQLALWFVIITTLIVFTLLPFSKVRFAPSNLHDLGLLLATFLGFSYDCRKRGMLRLTPGLEAAAIGTFMTVPCLIATYLAASLDLPLMDTPLMRADAALGLDWNKFIAFVDAHPALACTLARAYSSFPYQLLGLPVILGLIGRQERCYVMILSFGVICYISTVVSIWFPALGTYSMYGVTQDQLHSINAFYGYAFLHDFNAVREQPEFVLSVANASGIITFPSVHAAGAFLCAWAAWGLKAVRYPFALWNTLMAISAVSHANHYLIDVVGGVAVSALSIFLVTRLVQSIPYELPRIGIPASIYALAGRRQRTPQDRPFVP
jgi:membrane-associated phospholipid phosphatase